MRSELPRLTLFHTFVLIELRLIVSDVVIRTSLTLVVFARRSVCYRLRELNVGYHCARKTTVITASTTVHLRRDQTHHVCPANLTAFKVRLFAMVDYVID